MELIVFICTVFGTVIAYLAYKNQAHDGKKEKAEFLKLKYEKLQQFHKSLLERINHYVVRNNCMSHQFNADITFRQLINLLNIGYEKHFPADLMISINNLNKYTSLSEPGMDDALRWMDEQIETLNQIDHHLKFNYERILDD